MIWRGGDNEKLYPVRSVRVCNLILRIPLKLGHRGKGGKPEDLRKEQGIESLGYTRA